MARVHSEHCKTQQKHTSCNYFSYPCKQLWLFNRSFHIQGELHHIWPAPQDSTFGDNWSLVFYKSDALPAAQSTTLGNITNWTKSTDF